MSYYAELIERIKQELPIDSLLPQEAVGKRSIRCPLPDHDDHGPSCTIYRETNSWICWSHPGGRSAGSVLDYIMAERGVSFREAVSIGADMLGIQIQPPTEEERFEMERWRQREDILTTLARVSSGWLQGKSSTAASARAYLEGRGFDAAFLAEHQLGLVDIRKLYDIRPTHPLLSEFTEEQFDELGLRKDDEQRGKKLLYGGARLAIPLLRRQRVVGYTFRDLEGGHPAKYLHLPGAAGIYNEDALAHREVYLTEGVPDCWTLMAWGIPAAGNLGVHAVKHAQRFRHVQVLTLVWDNDEAGRKNVLRTAKAIQAQMKDGEVGILHMPGAKDINAWAQAGGTAAEFKALAAQAPSLLEYMIQLLPDAAMGQKLGREERPLWEDVLRMVGRLAEVQQSYHLKLMGKRLGCSLLALRKDLQQVLKESESKVGQPMDGDPVEGHGKPVSGPSFQERRTPIAALDFDFTGPWPRANIGVWLRSVSEGLPGDPVEYLVECTHAETGPVTAVVPYRDRQVDDPKLARFPDPDLPNWNLPASKPYSVESFIADPVGCTPNTAHLFTEIRQLLKDYIWYPEEHEYDIVSAWILMTYVYPVFGSVGFIHFHGMKSSGKSLSLDFVEKLAFNARKMDSATEAVLFRVAHNNRATLILDEAEKFNHPRSGTPEHSQRLLLNGSYKRGSKATRINMDAGKAEYFETFSPKCFGSINEIDHVLGDRCIVVRCLKIRHQDVGTCLDYAQTSDELHARAGHIRNMLHCWALTHFHKVRDTFKTAMKGAAPQLMAREREVWMPLLTLAHMIDTAAGTGTTTLTDRLLKAHQVKLAEKQEKERRENIDIIVLQALLDLLEDEQSKNGLEVMGTANWFPAGKLAEEIHKELVEEGTWPFDARLTSNKLIGLLKKTSILKDTDIRRSQRESKRGSIVYMRPETVAAALERLKGTTAEEEDRSLAASEPVIAAEATSGHSHAQTPVPPPAPPAPPAQAGLGFDDKDIPF